MQSAAPPPTITDELWFEWAVAWGCIACLVRTKQPHTKAEMVLLPDSNGIREQRRSVALCDWHRIGALPECLSFAMVRERRGPSLVLEPDAFRQVFGRDDELLEFQRWSVAHYAKLKYRGDVIRTLGLEHYLTMEEPPYEPARRLRRSAPDSH